MKTLLHIFSFEWKSLRRGGTLPLLLLVVLGAGVYGIYFGKFEVDKQVARIGEVEELERQQFDSLALWIGLDTSVTVNRGKFLLASSPTGVGRNRHFTYYLSRKMPALAGLCLGQIDLYPVYYGLNVTDRARQMNVSELANPMKLLTGNFDLSYVFIFLFPLLVVALFYDLYAGEQEGGTLFLLRAQPVSLSTVLFSKGLLRLLIIWSAASLLLLIGFAVQGISLSANGSIFLQWWGIICAYCLAWAVLMAAIVRLRRSTSLTAILGLGAWLIFTLITPALLNLVVTAQEPLPRRAEAIHVVRTLNGDIWASPKSFVMEGFYQKHPELNFGDTTDFNKWYYAGFTLIDQEADKLNAQFEERVDARNALLDRWKWLAPAALTHELLAHLSHTDRDSHRKFVEDVQETHQELKELYYTRIFTDKPFSTADLQSLERYLE